MPSTATTPTCPKCESAMKLRKGARGDFYGCVKFPSCNGTRNADGSTGFSKPVSSTKYEAIKILPGSPEQESIWDGMLRSRFHMVVDAVAGSGKTWTMIQGCLRMPKIKRILFLAFNKHIATEAQGKLAASGCDNVVAATYHSLGYKILRSSYPKTKINDNKLDEILETVPEVPELHYQWGSVLSLTRKLVALAKNYVLDFKAADFIPELERLADHHGLDLDGAGDTGNVYSSAYENPKPSGRLVGRTALSMVAGAMQESLRRAPVDIDFDDMIWIPVYKDLPMMEKWDMLITDESQDLNTAQHQLAFKACFAGRIVIVGDTRQAIYGFRGACATSMADLTAQLKATPAGVKIYPLTVTRRCPKSHVALAQAIVPQIKALDDAPEGVLRSMEPHKAVAEMKPGDLAICRVNAKLIPIAYELIARGIKPVVKGRDIGQGILNLIEKLQKTGAATIPALSAALQAYKAKEMMKLSALGEKAAGRIDALGDKCDCLGEFIHHSASIPELKSKIESIFGEFDNDGKPKDAVVLGTVHRTKGLEAHRVFVLCPELLPHPMAKKAWQREQEANLAYVAVTRAAYSKTEPGTIIFLGPIPAIFHHTPAPVEDLWEGVTEKVIHGTDCEKVEHKGSGYLHAADDDLPYEVDGAAYCGRCHRSLRGDS